MSAFGPELPSHLLAKRKRQQEADSAELAKTTPGAKRSNSPENGEKRRKVIGPSMPPAPLDERPNDGASATEEAVSESDDDDIGPALPSASGAAIDNVAEKTDNTDQGEQRAAEKDQQRDEWMMMPPKQDDLAARMDPSKPRARGFNTGKGAKGPSASAKDGSSWHETPEEKRKRLQDEVMGVAPSPAQAGTSAASSKDSKQSRKAKEAAEVEQQTARGPSLMEQHARGREQRHEEDEDDPSKRGFDREKDMGGGMRISASQRREMLSKASKFSSRFSGGSYL